MEARTITPEELKVVPSKSFMEKDSFFLWFIIFMMLFFALISYITGDIMSLILYFFLIVMIFIIKYKKLLNIKYRAIHNAELTQNIIHHNFFYPRKESKKNLFQKSYFIKTYKDIVINNFLKTSLITFSLLFWYIIIFLLFFWEPNISKDNFTFFIYNIVWVATIIISIWIFFSLRKYNKIKNEVYWEKNDYYFLVYDKKSKYYYDILENEKGGNDFLIY